MLITFPPSELRNWISLFYPPETVLYLTPDVYTVDLGDIADAGTEYGQLQVSQQSDFCVLGIATNFDTVNSTGNLLNCTLSISDAATGMPFFANTVSPMLIGATPETASRNRPINLAWPKLLAGNSALSVQMKNSSGGTIDSATVSFIGVKVRQLS